MFRQLKLILWKNLKIRKRHFLLTIIEIIVPVISFALIAYGRSKIDGLNKTELNETHHEPFTTDELFSHLPVGELELWYTPYTDFTSNIIDKVQETFQIPREAIRDFTSEKELMKHFTKSKEENKKFIAAIFFRGNDPEILNYEIGIQDKHATWHTNELFVPNLEPEDTCGPSNYIYKGYVGLQIAINMAFMQYLLEEDMPNITITTQPFPEPPRTIDSGIQTLFAYYLPLITIFSFIFLFPAVMKRVSEEKDSGAKEFMKMLGMKSSVIWFGWLIHALSTNLFSVIMIVVLMKVSMWEVPYPPIEFSNGVILFLFIFLYCMASITFCFLIAALFNTPSVATITGILMWIFSFFIPQHIVTTHENLSWGYKVLFGIFPNMALHYGYSAISLFEMRNVGVQWHNINESASGGQNDITMIGVYSILIFDMIIFMLLTVYIENVKPGKYGVSKSLFYPIESIKNKIFSIFVTQSQDQSQNNEEWLNLEEGTSYIEIKNLHKKFNHCVVIDNLDINFYKGNITTLLGPNGAGKSTMIAILTGMIQATSGNVRINGKEIEKHADELRPKIGLCPQHNLLFPDLTVKEHLKFFGMLRGLSIGDAKNEAKKILDMFKMTDKKHSLTHALSGGMKRKLCLGMALIGNTELLVLDEPTSGMDPESRREVWKLLQEQKKSKTILITTHFMEEADAIGDQIAIMTNGKLQCYDTPMNLKRKYNTGYHLSLMLKSKKSLQEIQKVINRYIQNAFILRKHANNIVFLIPSNEKQSISQVIYELERKRNEFDIINTGINITTLNDVFLKAKEESDGENIIFIKETLARSNKEITELKKSPTLYKQIKSLWLKRWYFLKRNFAWYFITAIMSLSIFLVAISLGLQNCTYCEHGGFKLNLNLNIYGETKVYYNVAVDNPNFPEAYTINDFYNSFIKSQKGNPISVNNVSQEIIKEGVDNIAFYKQHMIAAAEFSKNGTEFSINCLYSNRAYHGLPISVNLAMNALLKTLTTPNAKIIAISNAPLKLPYTDSTPNELSETAISVLWLFFFPIGMLIFMSSFIIFPNSEIPNKFLQLQIMAGAKIWVYWLMNIIFDFMMCLFKLTPLFLIMEITNWAVWNGEYFTNSDFQALVIIFACHTVSSLPFTYLFSYRKTIVGGFSLFLVLGCFTGIVATMIVNGLEFYNRNNHDAAQILKSVTFVLTVIFPHFGLSYTTFRFARKYVENFNWIHMNPDKKKYICTQDSYLEDNPCCYGNTEKCSKYQNYFLNEKLGIQWILVATLGSFCLYFIILCLWNTIHKFRSSCGVPEGTAKEVILDAINLTKSYGPKKILNKLKLQLKKHQCYGLLGVNGAGKSTAFGMLTRNISIEKGSEITIQENETTQINVSSSKYLEKIGYCPQKDSLNFSLTGRELLLTIACLRGYSSEDLEKIVNFLLKLFDLEKYAKKPCSQYSGGNKRKLSCCIAFLGFPSAILLDEPTNGVDPSGRRDFWDILSSLKNDHNLNTSFLLCSHSMEECEALCDEIGILVDGHIDKKGSLPELREKIKNGYTVTIKLKCGTQNDIKESVAKRIKERLGCECTMDDQNVDLLKFYVKLHENNLSDLFTLMECMEHDIEDYVISQSSLEDIFLQVNQVTLN